MMIYGWEINKKRGSISLPIREMWTQTVVNAATQLLEWQNKNKNK